MGTDVFPIQFGHSVISRERATEHRRLDVPRENLKRSVQTSMCAPAQLTSWAHTVCQSVSPSPAYIHVQPCKLVSRQASPISPNSRQIYTHPCLRFRCSASNSIPPLSSSRPGTVACPPTCVSDTSDRSLGVRAGGRDAVVATSLLYRQVLIQPRVHDVHEEAWEQRLVAEKAEGF